ncbi:hypothetical protein [Acetobacterium wieringae]|uniref:hypothetical protein n=1 Tax=Acetobacterium wieringae TaxID=52694 RepID=UPI003B8A83DD
MATTRLISMHQNNGKSITNCLRDRTDYAKNPYKTNDGEYISSYECDPKTVLYIPTVKSHLHGQTVPSSRLN